MEVDINLVRPSPFQPRMKFDIEDLKQEIQKDGLLSTLIVRKDDGHYELIDGERRLRALRELGWKNVPVEVRPLDDRLARLSIWKLNTVREEYDVEERATYFKKLKDGGMNVYQISEGLSLNWNWIQAHLNVFKLPKELREAVWTGQLSISHVEELEELVGAGRIDEAADFAKQVILRRMTRDELRKTLEPTTKRIEEERVEAARKAVSPRGDISLTLEEPRELEKAARALLKEAKKKQDEMLTPKEREALERSREVKKQNLSRARQTLEEKVRAKVEQEVKTERVESLLKDPEVVRRVLKDPSVAKLVQQQTERPSPISNAGGKPQQKQGYLTLEEPLTTQYQHQREWNLKQLVGKDLSRTGKNFQFDFLTIGYSQKTVEDFVNSLKLARAKILIDVRRKPQSMYKPEFNKDNLSKELSARGIEYIHMPELGIPRELRDEVYEGTTTAKVILDQYEKDVLKNGGLRNLQERVKGRGTFVIMCTEVDPTNCHRHKIAEALVEKGMVGYDL